MTELISLLFLLLNLETSNIRLFESKQIRTVWNEADHKWYFVVEDVVGILTDSNDPKQYIKRMRQRDAELAKGWVQIVPTLPVETAGGIQKIGCANAQGLLRIIQSIPSPKTEPFKLWLAQVGSDRLDEIENPELATQRTRELYKLKGYPDDWIKKRMRSIAICLCWSSEKVDGRCWVLRVDKCESMVRQALHPTTEIRKPITLLRRSNHLQ